MALRAGVLIACLLIAGCGAATSTTGSIDATPAPASHGNGTRPGQVTVDGGLTELTDVGGEIVLTLSVTNEGPGDIRQLTVILNQAYMAQMTVLETLPSATRHNEQGGEYFIFGSLASGETGKYVIRMSPRADGEYTAKIDVADWSPVDMVPLREASGGPAEFTDGTEVVAR